MRTKKINSQNISNGAKRIDGKFFLNEDSLYSAVLEDNKNKCIPLSQIAEVFNPPIFKRKFCQNTERSVMYFQSSDVPSLSEYSSVFINKKQAEVLKTLVFDNQILVTGFGTIGNVRLVSKLQKGVCYANNVCRITTKSPNLHGFIYAFMASKYAKAQLNKNASGSVVRFIEAPGIKRTLVPLFPESKQQEIHNLIVESANLRVDVNQLLDQAKSKLLAYANLPQLTANGYDYFGARSEKRTVSCFSKSIKKIDSSTLNAFNHSFRIEKTKQQIQECCQTIPLEEVLNDKNIFSTGSFPRVEVNSENGIMLINQKDIFDTIIKGKRISRRKVKTDSLIEYGEVLIAGVGTLGENETFCRAIFANEDLQGQLVSGEFIRMKTNEKYLSGYLFTWLNSDYGFRLIRNTQTGTKLCRPIPRLFLQIPVPVLEEVQMIEIDQMVKKAYVLHHLANVKENQAISLVEKEIESWQQS